MSVQTMSYVLNVTSDRQLGHMVQQKWSEVQDQQNQMTSTKTALDVDVAVK